MDTLEKLQKIIVQELSIDKESITPEAHLQEDLGADSFALVSLAEIIGTQFGIELQIDDLVEMECVGDLVKFIESG